MSSIGSSSDSNFGKLRSLGKSQSYNCNMLAAKSSSKGSLLRPINIVSSKGMTVADEVTLWNLLHCQCSINEHVQPPIKVIHFPNKPWRKT